MRKQQRLFVREYLKDLNATQAAIRSGYSAKGAFVQGSRLLSNVKIAEAIEKGFEKRADKVEIDANYVLERLASIDKMNVSDILEDNLTLRPLSEWPLTWKQSISSIDLQEISVGMNDSDAAIHYIKKLKWPDKIKNLELLGKHVNVMAFKERIDHLHTVTLEELVTGESDG